MEESGINIPDSQHWIPRIHMFLGLPDPDPLVDVWIRIRILLSSRKKNEEKP
jgi:hypothetical protein